YNPYELSTLVDHKHYIGFYEPSGLLLTQDIPRMRYAMYLQSDAYNALIKMYQDLSQNHSGFILKEAYKSAQSLDEKEIGMNEFQLGTSISITQSQVSYKDFENTEMSKWLEEHAYEYGYILRYPKNKASVTNHAYDAHIYRYVGKSLAKSLNDSHLTLEEYLDMEE
ncbi:MAG: M15 family metallopeptidase, partial [Coprobacillus sp.]|nr:M15 family metallopeptidase [Coprobacillus sp.]